MKNKKVKTPTCETKPTGWKQAWRFQCPTMLSRWRLLIEVNVSSLNFFPHPLQVSQNSVFVVKHWGHETNKTCEDYEYCSENCISKLHLGLNISIKFNEMFIDAFVVFCRLREPKLLLAGGRSGKKGRRSLQLGGRQPKGIILLVNGLKSYHINITL